MGTTIGINTFILLGSFSYLLKWDDRITTNGRLLFRRLYWTLHSFLLVFWLSLIVAGILKAIGQSRIPMPDFATIMKPVEPFLILFVSAGWVMAGCLVWILWQIGRAHV